MRLGWPSESWKPYQLPHLLPSRARKGQRMAVKMTSAIWEYSQAKGSELLVMLAIADNADDHGKAYPSIQYIAKKPDSPHAMFSSYSASSKSWENFLLL